MNDVLYLNFIKQIEQEEIEDILFKLFEEELFEDIFITEMYLRG